MFRKVLIFFFLLASVFLMQCSSTYLQSVNLTTSLQSIHSTAQIKNKESGKLAIDLNPHVYKFIFQYLRLKKSLARIIKRSYYYVPMMEKVFKEEGLPIDLVYLPVIESGYVTSAYSHKRASGPWQFMAYTGRIYGLHSNWWLDDRQDPELSTRAAAKHLKTLYRQFKNWDLALAAYNAGGGKISRAIKRYKTHNFWDMVSPHRIYLKKETKYYVPKFLAAMAIIRHKEKFGITNLNLPTPLLYDSVPVPDSTDLHVIAKCCHSDFKILKELNPSLKQWATPPGETNFKVKIPQNTSTLFYQNFNAIPASNRIVYRRYKISEGDTISGIAYKFSIPQKLLMSFNHLSTSSTIQINHYLILPLNGNESIQKADNQLKQIAKKRKTRRKKTHTKKIAKKKKYYDPALYKKKIKKYTVKSGDNLWKISKKFKVPIDEIKSTNALSHTKIQPGMELTIIIHKEKRKFF